MESAFPAIAGQLDQVHSANQCKRRTATVTNLHERRINNRKNNKKEDEEP